MPGFTLLKSSAMTRELEGLLGRRVDVVSERGLRERIRDRVLKEAIPLLRGNSSFKMPSF
jgi:predicted nucleotidyltransferase